MLKLRLFGTEEARWKQGVKDRPDLKILAISQFTLYARTDKGSKPDFHGAMMSEEAIVLFDKFVAGLREEIGEGRVETGAFGQYMEVSIVNDGPVTIIIDSAKPVK